MEQKCIQLIEQLLDDPEMKVLPAEEIVKDYLTQKYKESLYDERQYMSSQVPHFSNWNKEKPMELLMVSVDACDVDKTNGNPDALKEEEIKRYEENQIRKVYREKILNFVPDKKLINYWKCILECIETSPMYKLIDLYINLEIKSLKAEQAKIPFLEKKDINGQKQYVKKFYKCAEVFVDNEEILNNSVDFFDKIEKNIAKGESLHFNWNIEEDKEKVQVLTIDGDFISIQAALLFYDNIGKIYEGRESYKFFKYEKINKIIETILSLEDQDDFCTWYLIEKMTGRNMCICLSYYYTKILSKDFSAKSSEVRKRLDYIVKQLCKLKNVSMRPQIVRELFEPILYFFYDIDLLEVLNLIGEKLSVISKEFTEREVNVLKIDIEKCNEYCEKMPEKVIDSATKWELDITPYIINNKRWKVNYKKIQKIIFYNIT